MITVNKRGIVYIKEKETAIMLDVWGWDGNITSVLDCLYHNYGYRCNRLDESVLLKYVRTGKIVKDYVQLLWRYYHKGLIK